VVSSFNNGIKVTFGSVLVFSLSPLKVFFQSVVTRFCRADRPALRDGTPNDSNAREFPLVSGEDFFGKWAETG
jgi:hypothetical protein